MAYSEDAPLLVNHHVPDVPYRTSAITPYLTYCVGAAAISSFVFGYHTGVINLPKEIITNCNATSNDGDVTTTFPACFPSIDETLWGLIVGMFPIGGLIGGLFAGYLADNFGRRNIILFNNLFFIVGAALQALSFNELFLVFGRLIVGIGAGIASVAVPMYIGEITTPSLRGAFGVLFQLMLTIGILFSQLMGLALSYVPGWRWLLGLSAFFSVLQIFLLLMCCESPRWLILQRRQLEAAQVLSRLRGTLDVQDEVNLMNLGQASQLTEESRGAIRNIINLLSNRSFHLPLAVAIVLSLAQQLSGVNVVFYYSTSLFEETVPEYASLLTVMIGVWNVLLTLLAVFLMDRLGRRPLLLFGELGMAIVAGIFVISYSFDQGVLGVLSAFLFVLGFAVGLGPIPFLIISEIFPTADVATASSIALPFNWAANYAVAQIFPIMRDALTEKYVFIPFIVTNMLSFAFTAFFVPETKGRSLEEITSSYSK